MDDAKKAIPAEFAKVGFRPPEVLNNAARLKCGLSSLNNSSCSDQPTY
jgi:hypothetical protein